MKGKYTKEAAIALLQAKQKTLSEAGENRFPKRDDFSDEEVSAIKAFLGPWPRALEAAGVKAPRTEKTGMTWKEKRVLHRRKAEKRKKEL